MSDTPVATEKDIIETETAASQRPAPDYSRFKNIPQVLVESARKYPDRVALEWVEDGVVRQVKYAEFFRTVQEWAVGLSREIAFRRTGEQDFVTIHAQYGEEIFPTYWGVLANRAIFAGIQDSQDLKSVLSELKPRAIVAQHEDYLRRIAEVYDSLPQKPERIILLRGEVPDDVRLPNVVTSEQLRERGRKVLEENPNAFMELIEGIAPEDVATLTSTSGSTGEPKAFLFSHEGQIKAAQSLINAFRKYFPLTENAGILNGAYPSDDIFSFFTLLIAAEGDKAYFFTTRDREKVFQSLKVKGPELWFMTPQLVYDINRGFQHQLDLMLGKKVSSFIYKLASRVGYKYFESKFVTGKKLGLKDRLLHKLCDKVAYSKLREFLGGRFYGVVIGSQKLDHRALGVMGGGHAFVIKQNYGTREVGTIGFGINNIYTFDDGVEYKLVTDEGELHMDEIRKRKEPVEGVLKVKTPGMALCYYPNTKPLFEDDGFFNTGDIVRILPDGRMEFLGREKYWIYDNGAEAKFNPEDIEGLLKVINGVVNAIVVSRFEHTGGFVPEHPTTNRSLTAILATDLSYEEVLPHVVAINKKLPPLRRLAGFITVPASDWEPGKGLVTESMKPRRGLICERYEKLLDELYMKIDRNGGKPLIGGHET